MSKLKIIFFVFAIFFIFGISSHIAFAASYTASQTGNWSSSSTWGGAGVPGDGDTATIGAFTVTVDTNTTVGTSPNDTTTKVINLTSASSVLSISASAALTVKGNIGLVNGSTLSFSPGGDLIFDGSGSGGTPIYTLVNVGFTKLNAPCTSVARCTISAVSGQTFSFGSSYSQLVLTFVDFTRMAATQLSVPNIDSTITDNTFTSCGKLTIASTSGGTQNRVINRNRFISGTNTETPAQDLNLGVQAAYTSGTREFLGNVMTLAFTYNSVQFDARNNYFGGGIDGVSGRYYSHFTNNFIKGTRANGQRIQSADISENYWYSGGSTGNPHFFEGIADSADLVISSNVFESSDPDLIDYGDVILIVNTDISAGRKITGTRNIVLPNVAAGNGVSSGTMLTLYNAGSNTNTEWYNNTVNVNNPSSGSLSKRAAWATAEAGTGFAGQISALKSNLVWGSTSGQGYIGERLSGSVQDIITSSNADYNWTWNTTVGNNGRAYNDTAGSGNLWVSGNASAAGVDNTGGSAEPRFVDSSRNLTKWVVTRGYGSNAADGLTALQSDSTRIADLVDYVFAGFIPTNLALKGKAHDGGDPGVVPISVFNTPGGNVSTSLTTSFSGGMAY